MTIANVIAATARTFAAGEGMFASLMEAREYREFEEGLKNDLARAGLLAPKPRNLGMGPVHPEVLLPRIFVEKDLFEAVKDGFEWSDYEVRPWHEFEAARSGLVCLVVQDGDGFLVCSTEVHEGEIIFNPQN